MIFTSYYLLSLTETVRDRNVSVIDDNNRLILQCLGNALQKEPKAHRFKLDRGAIWQDCSSGKYASSPSVCDCHWLAVCAAVPDPWDICTCLTGLQELI